MATHLDDGFGGTATITGTGAYTNIQPLAGYTPFSAMPNGKVTLCTVRTLTGFECGLYIKTGGTTPQLARNFIFTQFDQTSTAVNWPAGTVVTIISSLSAKDVACITDENFWTQDQYYRGHALHMSPDDSTYLKSAINDFLELQLANSSHTTWSKGGSGENALTVVWVDSGATSGPAIQAYRSSTSPASGDGIGFLVFSGNNQAAAAVSYASLIAKIVTTSAGAENGRLELRVLRSGAATNALVITDHLVSAFPGITTDGSTALLVGKSAQGLGNIGVELVANGAGAFTTGGTTPLLLNRIGSDGNYIECYRDTTTYRGGLTFPAAGSYPGSGKLGLNGALLFHPTDGADFEPDPPSVGTVVSSIDELYDDIHPKCRVTTEPSDPAVRGVYWAPDKKHGGHIVAGAGTGLIRALGPVRHGQLLESSAVPGVAWAVESKFQSSATVAKAMATVPDDGAERTIPCTLLAG